MAALPYGGPLPRGYDITTLPHLKLRVTLDLPGYWSTRHLQRPSRIISGFVEVPEVDAYCILLWPSHATALSRQSRR